MLWGPDVRLVDDTSALVGTASSPLHTFLHLHNETKDAFGRMRISTPHTLFDSKQIFDNAPIFWNEALESGGNISASHDVNKAATTITSTDSVAGKFTRQTYMSFNYQPGKSQLIEMTGTLDLSGGGTGVQRRIGQFNDSNGLFFEDDEGTIKVVLRSKVSGSVVDTKVAQTSWNVDKMDGTGVSGVTMDWTKSQVFVIDYQWLSVGHIRYGLMHDGSINYIHSINNANANIGAYMSTPNLPLRYQMVTTSSSPASTMLCICSTVISEGGSNRLGLGRRKSTAGVHIDADVIDTLYAMIGVKLKATHIGAVVVMEVASILAETNDNFEWVLMLNPTVANTFTYANETNSAVMTVLGDTDNTVTGGTELAGGWEANKTGLSVNLENARYLGASIAGVVDEIVLCVRPMSANANIQGSLSWREAP